MLKKKILKYTDIDVGALNFPLQSEHLDAAATIMVMCLDSFFEFQLLSRWVLCWKVQVFGFHNALFSAIPLCLHLHQWPVIYDVIQGGFCERLRASSQPQTWRPWPDKEHNTRLLKDSAQKTGLDWFIASLLTIPTLMSGDTFLFFKPDLSLSHVVKHKRRHMCTNRRSRGHLPADGCHGVREKTEYYRSHWALRKCQAHVAVAKINIFSSAVFVSTQHSNPRCQRLTVKEEKNHLLVPEHIQHKERPCSLVWSSALWIIRPIRSHVNMSENCLVYEQM